jgi:hypothetical protein
MGFALLNGALTFPKLGRTHFAPGLEANITRKNQLTSYGIGLSPGGANRCRARDYRTKRIQARTVYLERDEIYAGAG